jgi:1-aminocyclopropane-1-carboxylate deaminase/D-cysteine desulfhydrase-like pyridoxal-dependent ACC family enzyme
MNYLHQYFPELGKKLPNIQLGKFPTPCEKLKTLSHQTGNSLYLKRDDISGDLYGGNKVRKLEYLLADAQRIGSRRIITSGAVGSNHALAVATYSSKLGFKVVLMLFGDQRGEHVKMNLLADCKTGAEMCYDVTYEEHQKHLAQIEAFYKEKDGIPPYIIPAGGTSVLGMAGYVNAAFEIKAQIDCGEIPSPDAVFLPFGTMGTAAGLVLGMKVAGVQCKVIPILVVPSFVADENKFSSLVKSANEYYHSLDESFPMVEFKPEEFKIDKSKLGPGYGLSTKQSDEAIKTFRDLEGVTLDGVYSGKAAAAFLEYCYVNNGTKKNICFWNTKSSIPLEKNTEYKSKLPEQFQMFFDSAS